MCKGHISVLVGKGQHVHDLGRGQATIFTEERARPKGHAAQYTGVVRTRLERNHSGVCSALGSHVFPLLLFVF